MDREYTHNKTKMKRTLPFLAEEARTEAIASRDKCRFLKSTTYVGCTIFGTDKKMYSGCNFDFEFGIAIHGEESAINKMINTSSKDCMIDFVYIYAEVSPTGLFTSCGSCRDKMRLFAKDKENMLVYFDNGTSIVAITIGELIPYYPRR